MDRPLLSALVDAYVSVSQVMCVCVCNEWLRQRDSSVIRQLQGVKRYIVNAGPVLDRRQCSTCHHSK